MTKWMETSQQSLHFLDLIAIVAREKCLTFLKHTSLSKIEKNNTNVRNSYGRF